MWSKELDEFLNEYVKFKEEKQKLISGLSSDKKEKKIKKVQKILVV